MIRFRFVNHTLLFNSAALVHQCIASPAHGERGSGNSGRSAVSPAGMSTEPMGLQWSHDIEVCVHKMLYRNRVKRTCMRNHACGMTANDVAMRSILHVTLTMITFPGHTLECSEFPDPLSACW